MNRLVCCEVTLVTEGFYTCPTLALFLSIACSPVNNKIAHDSQMLVTEWTLMWMILHMNTNVICKSAPAFERFTTHAALVRFLLGM